MGRSADLRGLAAKCRRLADLTASPNDRQVLHHTAAQFEAEADEYDVAADARLSIWPGREPPTQR